MSDKRQAEHFEEVLEVGAPEKEHKNVKLNWRNAIGFGKRCIGVEKSKLEEEKQPLLERAY